MNIMDYMKKDERIALELRELYERYGYTKVTVSDFEEYELYAEHRSFLSESNLITFMNTDAQLMALRPDVTLSIVKNTSAFQSEIAQKNYYVESVYRFMPENSDYKRIDQLGIECIDGNTLYANAEVLNMALESLSFINDRFIMDMSHMGFVSGLLSHINLGDEVNKSIFANLHTKNVHDMSAVLDSTDISPEDKARILKLCSLDGKFESTIERAREIVINDQMEEALVELEEVYRILSLCGCEEYLDRINLDFSVINDLDYYNGIIFRGYIENLSKVVLSGGRYDNLLRKLGKQRKGIGFAISLDELDRYFESKKQYDFDIVILYQEGADLHRLLSLVREYVSKGRKVRVEQMENSKNLTYTYRELYHLDGGHLKSEV